MKLYNNAGTLTWNGTPLAAGSSVSGTVQRIPFFTASNAIGDSIMLQDVGATTISVGGLLATTTLSVASTSNIIGVATFTAAPVFSSGTASLPLFLDGSKNLTSNSISGTGSVAMTNSPTFVTPTLGNASATKLSLATIGILTAQGDITYDVNAGITIWGKSAGLYALSVLSAAGNYVIRNPTGTDNVEMPGGVTVGTLNTYTFNQSVAIGAAPSFNGGNIGAIPEANISDGTILARLAANETVTGVYDFSNGFKAGGGATISSSSNVALLDAANTFTAFGTHSFSASGDNTQNITIANASTGASADGSLNLTAGSTTGSLNALSQNYTAASYYGPSMITLASNGAGGMSIVSTHASGDVRLYSRNALALTLGASQAATFTGAVTMSAYGAGTATFDASGNITSVSDERQKDIQGAFTPGLNALMGLAPITYRYKASTGLDTENVYAGFSAQNVRDYIPEAIGKNLDGMYSLNIVPVLAATVTAVQELSREVDELRAAAKLTAKVRTQAKADDTRVITSATPTRLAEKAKAESDRLAAEKVKAAQDARQALRARLAACDAEQDVIEAQGGTRQACAVTDAEKAERKALQSEAAAATAKAAEEAAAQAKSALASCVALNVKIEAAGGKPKVCGMP
jgi:hypothetical protein